MDFYPQKETTWDGKVTIISCSILWDTFKFSTASWKKFLEFTESGNLTISNGYLAREINGRTEFFHRWFKLSYGSPDLEVHHRNGIITDNRSSNLKIITKEDHYLYHSKRREKIEEKYRERGERIRKRYEERGERMRERYRKRGERMQARSNGW